MIDTKELRRLSQAAISRMSARDPEFASSVTPLAVLELLDRLEAAEKERDDVAQQLVQSEQGKRKISKECESYKAAYNDWADKTEWVQQGFNEGTISAKYFGLHRADVMARLLDEAEKERDALRVEIEELHVLIAAVKKRADAEFCLRVKKEEEYTRLRAKIEQMERQEPAGKFIRHPSNGLWEQDGYGDNPDARPLYALPGAQQCKNCNGMGDRFDPSGEKIPCDLCESHLEEIRVLVAEAAHDIISGSDFWLSTSLAAKKIYALPGAQGEEK